MAKKGQANVPSSKTIQKEKQKMIEDATFGLKNKNKSKKVQEYCEQIKKQVESRKIAGQPAKPQISVSQQEALKREEAKRQQLMAMMRSTLKQPTVPPGQNPKDFVCIYFLHGCCDKTAEKCKFSHDKDGSVAAARLKAEQEKKAIEEAQKKQAEETQYTTDNLGVLDLYRDMREQILEYKARTQAKQNGKKYEEVLGRMREVEAKRTEKQNYSEHICKHYLKVCERREIGWSWVCPNEKTMGYCQYRHCLPEGYELHIKVEEADDDIDCIALEEDIDRRRNEIVNGTPITQETFAAWKAKRLEKKKAQEEKQNIEIIKKAKQRGTDAKFAGLTGRQLFERGIATADAEADAEEGQVDVKAAREDEKKIETEEAKEAEKKNEDDKDANNKTNDLIDIEKNGLAIDLEKEEEEIKKTDN